MLYAKNITLVDGAPATVYFDFTAPCPVPNENVSAYFGAPAKWGMPVSLYYSGDKVLPENTDKWLVEIQEHLGRYSLVLIEWKSGVGADEFVLCVSKSAINNTYELALEAVKDFEAWLNRLCFVVKDLDGSYIHTVYGYDAVLDLELKGTHVSEMPTLDDAVDILESGGLW